MKIKEEHYDQLKHRIDAFLDNYPEINCKEALENTKLRWNIYWKAGGFSNAQEYHYLDDSNIDTALKSILRERISEQRISS